MSASGYRELPYPLLPMLRAENGETTVDPDDLKYGLFVSGGQGCGKTSLLSRVFRNCVRDADAAPILMDGKPELAPLCLKLTPPGIGKRLWYLDLGHPAFGMNPLRLAGDRPLPVEAAQLAENIVAALLDINENQIFQSSRRYLYHAVIGAIAHAEKQGRRARFEDLYSLLLPANGEFREAVAAACSDQPDLDQTAAFFASELPEELQVAGSATAQRLDAPRNKVAGLVQVPALRRFFNHPTDIPIGQIIEARDVLIVDANMGAIGQENAKACMHFILRMLHSHMQRQVQWPDDKRPRVPLIIDEAHHVLGGENIVDQFATHRRAGLEPVCAVQYLAQIGSGSEHQEKILKGVMNLLQSRCMFRLGDPREAEELTRGAMSVYSTMIRDDPDSRARLRVAPDQALNFPNYFCLASWIGLGARMASFTGETYPIPDGFPEWTEYHLAEQAKRVAPYPDALPSTLQRPTPSAPSAPRTELWATRTSAELDGQRLTDKQRALLDALPRAAGTDLEALRRLQARGLVAIAPRPVGGQPAPHDAPPAPASSNGAGDRPRVTVVAGPATAPPGHEPAPDPPTPPAPAPGDATSRPAPGEPRPDGRQVRPNYEPPPPPPKLDTSSIRRIVGQPAPDTPPRDPDTQAPEALRELAFLDRINEIGAAEQRDGAASLPRMYDQDYAILALLDRAGLAPTSLIGRATMPAKAARTVFDRLTKLYQLGLIAQHATGLRQHSSADGRPPLLYSLTARGLRVAQERSPAPAISPKREWRAVEQHNAGRLTHDLHALGWGIELHRLVGDQVATDYWRTARYASGRYPVPQTGSGRDRHPVTIRDLPIPRGQMISDLELKQFAEVKPDLSLELRDTTAKLSFDLLVELDRTARASYNHDKFLAYDAFLCAWSLAHRRYEAQGTRPAVIFVAPTPRAALALAQAADEAMTGRIGVMGTGPEHWYHAGRDHLFIATEADIYHHNLTALALPPGPPGLRERLEGTRELKLTRVELLPARLLQGAPRG